jgi:hypothetical protein
MRTVRRFLTSAAIAAVLGLSSLSALAGQGQDFPDTKCTCKECASNKGDLIGQCNEVCKDKTVYAKGSEPYDYCYKEEKK